MHLMHFAVFAAPHVAFDHAVLPYAFPNSDFLAVDSDIALQKCPQKMQRTLGGFPSDSVLRLVMHSTSRTCHRWPEKDNTHKICEIDLPISGRIVE